MSTTTPKAPAKRRAPQKAASPAPTEAADTSTPAPPATKENAKKAGLPVKDAQPEVAEDKAATAAADAPSAPPKPKSQEDWLAELDKLKGDDRDAPNAKYPDLSNAQVAATLRYQIASKGRKVAEPLNDEQGDLLRTAARVNRALLDGNLSGAEKAALVKFADDELDAEQIKRRDDPAKKGLSGKARFLWIVDGLDSKAQQAKAKAETKAVEKEKKTRQPAAPKDPSGQRMRRLDDADGRWCEPAWEKFAPVADGLIVFAVTDREKGTSVLIGQLPAAPAFYDHIQPALKAKGLDPEKVDLVTLSARYGYTNRPVAAEERLRPAPIGVEHPAAAAK